MAGASVRLGDDNFEFPRPLRHRGDKSRFLEAAILRGTEGSNPCTLQSGYWLVGIVDWPDRAGLPGVAPRSRAIGAVDPLPL